MSTNDELHATVDKLHLVVSAVGQYLEKKNDEEGLVLAIELSTALTAFYETHARWMAEVTIRRDGITRLRA